MKSKLIVVLLVFCSFITVFAQEFTVKSFKVLGNDIAAIKHEKTDINGQKCAIIKVLTNVEGAFYDSGFGIEHKEQKGAGEVWLWVSPREKRLKVKKEGLLPLNYDIPITIEYSKVYELQLTGVVTKKTIPVTILLEPQNATLTINGNIADGNPPTYKLPLGKNTLNLSANGYETLTKEIHVSDEHAFFTFRLNKERDAALQIVSMPAGARVTLDGLDIGTTPAAIFYKPGEYTIKLMLDGYVQREERIKIDLPLTKREFILVENTAFLTVKTQANANVYVGNKLIKANTTVKLKPQIANVKVVLPKAKALEQQIVLKRGDQKTISLFPNIQKGSVQIGVTPFEAKIELKGDAGEYFRAIGMKEFTEIPIGTYKMKVSCDGYIAVNQHIEVTAGTNIKKSIKLEKVKKTSTTKNVLEKTSTPLIWSTRLVDKSGSQIEFISSGEYVEILNFNTDVDEHYYVRYNGVYGYVHKSCFFEKYTDDSKSSKTKPSLNDYSHFFTYRLMVGYGYSTVYQLSESFEFNQYYKEKEFFDLTFNIDLQLSNWFAMYSGFSYLANAGVNMGSGNKINLDYINIPFGMRFDFNNNLKRYSRSSGFEIGLKYNYNTLAEYHYSDEKMDLSNVTSPIYFYTAAIYTEKDAFGWNLEYNYSNEPVFKDTDYKLGLLVLRVYVKF